jgi:branched-chain amino acid transport system substrate-binding protein
MMSVLSSTALAINPLVEKNKIIQISFATDANVSKGLYNFRIATSVENLVQMNISRMKKDGVKKVALIASNSDVASQMVGGAFEAAVKSGQDITITSRTNIKAGDKNFDVIMTKIKAENPHMLFLMALPPESDLVIRTMKKIGLNIPVTGPWTIASLKDKSLAEGMWFTDDAMATPEFTKEFEKAIGGTDTYYGEYAYAILSVMTNAWENAPAETGQKPNPEDVAKTMLNKTNGLKTALGALDIDDQGNVSLQGVFKMIQNGQAVLIKGLKNEK